MKNPFNRQSQFELFPDAPGQLPRKERSYIFGRSFELSMENLIVGGIIFFMVMIVSFSFGVERGRRSGRADISKQTSVASKSQGAMAMPDNRAIQQKGPEQVMAASLTGSLSQMAVPAPEGDPDLLDAEVALSPEKSVDKTAALETIHTVQVASYKQLAKAEQEVGNLKKLGYEAFTARKGTYYIVCVGRFPEKQQANALLKPLRKRYSDCYVRRL